VELLLASKADVNTKAHDGSTPLHAAAFHGHKDMVGLLLESGANVNAMTGSGATPRHWAAVKSHIDVVELLRQHGGLDLTVEKREWP
jgi:ankyrin repeat protein